MVFGVLDLCGDFRVKSTEDLQQVEEGCRGLVGIRSLPGCFVGFDGVIGPFKGLETKLLYVCLSNHVIGNFGLIGVLRFELLQGSEAERG